MRTYPRSAARISPVPLNRSLAFTSAPLESVSSSNRGSSPISLVASRYALSCDASLAFTSAPRSIRRRAASTSLAAAAASSCASRSGAGARSSPPQPASATMSASAVSWASGNVNCAG